MMPRTIARVAARFTMHVAARPTARTLRPTALLAALLAAALAGTGGCFADPNADIGAGHAVQLPVPYPRPAFTLTATDGKPFAFRERTRGTLTFVLFGYTHCPDVCPVHVANIAAAMRTLTFEERGRTMLIFITTDPERDSLPVLRSWLASFDSTFVGLRGTPAEVDAIALSLQVAPRVIGTSNPDGSYEVGHGAQVIVWQPDDTARVIYPFGVRQAEWAKDMPQLIQRQPSLLERIRGRP